MRVTTTTSTILNHNAATVRKRSLQKLVFRIVRILTWQKILPVEFAGNVSSTRCIVKSTVENVLLKTHLQLLLQVMEDHLHLQLLQVKEFLAVEFAANVSTTRCVVKCTVENVLLKTHLQLLLQVMEDHLHLQPLQVKDQPQLDVAISSVGSVRRSGPTEIV